MAAMRTRLLFPSCLHGDAARVRKLLSEGADANHTSPTSEYGGAYTGETPLFIAAREGHLDIVLSLLAHGADPRKACTWATPADGILTETPLHAAAAQGWTSIVEAVRMTPHLHPYASNLNTSRWSSFGPSLCPRLLAFRSPPPPEELTHMHVSHNNKLTHPSSCAPLSPIHPRLHRPPPFPHTSLQLVGAVQPSEDGHWCSSSSPLDDGDGRYWVDGRWLDTRSGADGLSALATAAMLRHVGCVRALAAAGADVDRTGAGWDEFTPFVRAVVNDHPEIVQVS